MIYAGSDVYCIGVVFSLDDCTETLKTGASEMTTEISPTFSVEAVKIAKVCYAVNQATRRANGDRTTPDWEGTTTEHRISMVKGVVFALENPHADGADLHFAWMMTKHKSGWVWGANEDADAKTHPCLLPYHKLSKEEQLRDHLFLAVVRSMASDAAAKEKQAKEKQAEGESV